MSRDINFGLDQLDNGDRKSMSAPVSGNVDQSGNADWKFALFILAAMPVMQMLATWDIDGNLGAVTKSLRLFSLPVVFLEILLLLWTSRKGWKPQQQIYAMSKLNQGFIIIFLFFGLTSSIFVASDYLTSLFLLFRYVLHALVLGAVIFLISTGPNFDIKRWMRDVGIGSAIYASLLILFCALVIKMANFNWVGGLPSATHIRQIGNMLGLMAIMPAAAILLSNRGDRIFAPLILHTALLGFVMWSGTRGALLGYLAAIFVAIWFCRSAVRLKTCGAIAVSWVIAALASLLIAVPSPYYGLIRVAGSLSTKDSSSGRWQMWSDAANAIARSPLLGHGIGTYRDNMAALNGHPYNHPHNFILQYVYDWGFIGGFFALSLIAFLGFSIWRSIPERIEEKFLAFAGFAGVLAIAMIEGSLFHPLPMIIGITLISPLLKNSFKTQHERKFATATGH